MPASTQIQSLIEHHLNLLQRAPAEKLLVFLPVVCGLGGQITGRVQTLALALALGRKAVFQRLDDVPYSQTFAAMHEPVAAIGDDEIPTADLSRDQEEKIVCYDPRRMPVHTPEIDAMLLKRVRERIGVNVPDRLLLEGVIFTWMRPTEAMRAFCEAERKRLGVTANTLGVHLRRGDKEVETAFVPASELNRQIAQLHAHWPFTSLFLASDSPTADEEITLPPGVKLIFDTAEQRYNNANHKMLIHNPALAEQETRVAYKNIWLLAHCGGVVGQDNAHFATLSGGWIAARDNRLDRIVLIDGRFAEKRSPLLAFYFKSKNAARAVARTLLPHMTATAKLKKRKF